MLEVVKEVPVTEELAPAEVVIEAAPGVPKPGEKTDPALLLESLKEERQKRKAAEDALQALKDNPAAPSGEVFSEEGKVLLGQISDLKKVISSREEKDQLAAVQAQFAPLKDKEAEFEQFRADNPGMKIETAAKSFLIENDLFEVPKPRKGLEKPSGGGRTPVQVDGMMTAQEADDLRVNNYNEYARRIKAGTLKIR